MSIVNSIKKALKDEKVDVFRGGRIPGAFLNRHPDFKKFVNDFVSRNGHIFNSTSEFLCWLSNGILIRRCPVCRKHLKYCDSRDNRGFFCSKTCEKSSEGKKAWAEYLKQKTLEKHGVENVFQLESTKQKIRQTNTERYGAGCSLQNSEIKNKAKQTMLKKYGVENPYQNEEIRARMTEKKRAGLQEKMIEILRQNNLEIISGEFLSWQFVESVRKPMILKCNKCGNTFEYLFLHTKNIECACPYCREANASSGERELNEFIKSFNIDFRTNDRSVIRPQELDIVIPSKKIAIEYDGLYYHSTENKGMNYHLNKSNLCKAVGYRLIHIFEDEWIGKKEIVKSYLTKILGFAKIIPADACIIRDINTKTVKEFVTANSLKAFVDARIHYGCFYKDKLIAVFSSAKQPFIKDDNYEIVNFTELLGIEIKGIIDKMLSTFKSIEINSLIIKFDKRYQDSTIFINSGFIFVKNTEPKRWYWKKYERIPKSYFTKERKNLEVGQTPESLGYRSIYDCGDEILKYE